MTATEQDMPELRRRAGVVYMGEWPEGLTLTKALADLIAADHAINGPVSKARVLELAASLPT